IRTAYTRHLEGLARLAGLPGREGLVAGSAEDLAAAVMDFETRLAACHLDVVRVRDREKSYNPMDATQRRQLAPAFPWDAYVEGTGAPAAAFDVVSIGQPEFVTAAAELLAGEDLAVLRSWLAVHAVSSYAPYGPAALVEEDFAFTGKVLSGAEELRERSNAGVAFADHAAPTCAPYARPALVEEGFALAGKVVSGAAELRERWGRGVAFGEGAGGFSVGGEDVARHFPASHKERMTELVDALMDAYRD